MSATPFGPTITEVHIKRVPHGHMSQDPVLATVQIALQGGLIIRDFIIKDLQGTATPSWPDRRRQKRCGGCAQSVDQVVRYCTECKYPLRPLPSRPDGEHPAFEKICAHNSAQYQDYVFTKILDAYAIAEKESQPFGEWFTVKLAPLAQLELTSVNVTLTDSQKGLLADCELTLNNHLRLLGLKLVQRATRIEMFMPDRRVLHACPKCRTNNHLRARYCGECLVELEPGTPLVVDGRPCYYTEIAYPFNNRCRTYLHQTLLRAYEDVFALRYPRGKFPSGSPSRAYGVIWTPSGQKPTN